MAEQKFNEGDSLSVELEGKIFLVHKDSTGKIVERDELNGETMIKALLVTIEDALRVYIPSQLADSLPKTP